jgi:hypothetical protein
MSISKSKRLTRVPVTTAHLHAYPVTAAIAGRWPPGPEDARAHGSDRAVHQLGDLFVAQAFDLAQCDGLAQIVGQGFDGCVHGGSDFLAGQYRVRRFAVA